MFDNNNYALGFAVGFLLVVVIFAVVVIIKRKRKNDKCEYDERQLLSRNFAYKCAFFTLLIYNAVCAVLNLAELAWATTAAQLFIGLFLAVTEFVIICVFNDAYFSFSSGKMGFLFIWCGVALLEWVVTFKQSGAYFTNGLLNEQAIYPCCAVMFTLSIISVGIKRLVDKRAAEEE